LWAVVLEVTASMPNSFGFVLPWQNIQPKRVETFQKTQFVEPLKACDKNIFMYQSHTTSDFSDRGSLRAD
jgi:hypothetical protein